MRPLPFCLKFDCVAGTSIEEAAEGLILLAEALNVGTECKFNGVTMRARAGDDAKKLALNTWAALRSNGKWTCAMAGMNLAEMEEGAKDA